MRVSFVPAPLVAWRSTGLVQRERTTRSAPRRHRAATLCASASPEGAEPSSLTARDWREVRAVLHAGSEIAFQAQLEKCHRPGHWAHPLSLAETGCFLASHPALFRRDAPYLTQSVVFLVDHTPAGGTTGLVLNRPLRGTLKPLMNSGVIRTEGDRELPTDAVSTLGDAPVYLGGPDMYEGSPLLVLEATGTDNRHGSRAWTEPRTGVQVAALDSAFSGRAGTPVDPPSSSARVFAGCVKWGAGKLEAEVDSGEWFVFSASTKYATEHCIQLPKPLWREIMESTGDPFAKIARQVYGED